MNRKYSILDSKFRSSYFLDKKKSFKDFLKVKYLELWQILSLLTVILSVTSLWFWYINLNLRLKDQTFLWIDAAKSKLFSEYQVITNYSFVYTDFLKQKIKLSNPCYKDIQKLKLDFTKSDLFFDKINQSEKVLIDLKNQINNSNYLSEIISDSEINSVFKEFDQYLGLIRAKTTDYVQSLNQTLLFKQLASEFCLNSNLEQQKRILFILQTNWQILNKNSSVDKRWLENAKDWLETSFKLVETNWPENINTDLFQELVKKFKNSFVLLFEIQTNFENWNYQTDLNGEIGKIDRKFLTSVENLQIWQNKYLSKKPNLKAKIVFIDLNFPPKNSK